MENMLTSMIMVAQHSVSCILLTLKVGTHL